MDIKLPGELNVLFKTGWLVLMDGDHTLLISPLKSSVVLALHKVEGSTDPSWIDSHDQGLAGGIGHCPQLWSC